MSKNLTQDDEFEIEEYRTEEGIERKTADVSSDGHALKQSLGATDSAKERKLDVTIGAERFVDLYESPDAALREMLANSESACLDRARIELRSNGYDVPDSNQALLDEAKEKCGYEPQVDVTHQRKPEANTLTLSDNGCGISTNRYEVIQNIGYSTSKDESSNVGMFGVGWYAAFTLCGKENYFEMVTRSVKSDETYGTMEYLGNVEYLDRRRDSYGTTFQFPAFCQSAKNISVADAVEKYSQGLRVTVVYREFDESGEEVDASEEYTPHRIEDDYSNDVLVVTAENDFFKAVMSPEDIDRSPVTYNISMPIQRNVERGYKSYNKLGAKWQYDVRLLREDGPICDCDSDESLVGKVPIEDSKYERKVARQTGFVSEHMVTQSRGETVDGGEHAGSEVIARRELFSLDCEASEEFVPLSEVPDDAVSMPKPSSSRDGYEKGNDDFWKHVSNAVMDAWKDMASDRFHSLDSWQGFLDMSESEQEGLVRAYNQFGPDYGTNEPGNIQDELDDQFGASVPESVCSKLDNLNQSYHVVEKNADNPRLVSASDNTNIRDILRDYDEVYVGKTMNKKRCMLVWGMPEDTAVVRLEDGVYDDVIDLWGWTKLTDVPVKNVREKLPQVDDDVLDEWADRSTEPVTQQRSNTSSRRTSRNPETKTVTVRTGLRSRRKMNDIKAGRLFDKLDSEDRFCTSSRGHRTKGKYLVLFDQTEIAGTTPPTSGCSRRDGIAAAAVPKYVYNYLIDAENAVDSFEAATDKIARDELDQFPDTEATVYVSGYEYDKYFDKDEDDFLDAVEEYSDTDLPDDVTIETSGPDIKHASSDAVETTMYGWEQLDSMFDDRIDIDIDSMIANRRLPDCLDDDTIGSQRFEHMFGYRKPSNIHFGCESTQYKLELVEELGGLPEADL